MGLFCAAIALPLLNVQQNSLSTSRRPAVFRPKVQPARGGVFAGSYYISPRRGDGFSDGEKRERQATLRRFHAPAARLSCVGPKAKQVSYLL
jgi:hypothetical protein